MSTSGGTSQQASVACAENFVSVANEGLQDSRIRDLLGPEQEAALGLVARNLGVLAIEIGQGAALEARVVRPSKVGVYVLGLSPAQNVAMNLSATLPDRASEDTETGSVFTGADIQKPSDSQMPSRHIVKGSPPTSIIVVYTDTAAPIIDKELVVDEQVAQKARGVYELTHVTGAYLHPERESDSTRVQAVREYRASHNEFAVLDSDRGYGGMLSDWVLMFEEQGDEFDEQQMVEMLDAAFPGPDHVTVRRAITARTLARMYGPRVTDDLIDAYQRHGYIPPDEADESTPEPVEPAEQDTAMAELVRTVNASRDQSIRYDLRPLKVAGVALTPVVAAATYGLVQLELKGYGPVDLGKDVAGLIF